MSVLITGGTGFFGQACVRRIVEMSIDKICIFSRGEYQQSLMRERIPDPNGKLRWFIGDVRDVSRLRRAMTGIDLVIHAAALKRVEVGEYNPTEMYLTNVGGTANVIEAATDASVARVVALSSDKACNPINTYGATKLVAEKLILGAQTTRGLSGPLFAAVRYGNVAGSTGSVIPTWRRAQEQGLEVTVTDPDCTRFWMHVDEAVNLVIDTAVSMHGGELAIPDLPAYRLGDLAEAMRVRYRTVGLPPGEKRHESMIPGVTSEEARRMSVDELREELSRV